MLRKEQFLNVFIWVPFGSLFGSPFGSPFGFPFGSPFREASDFGLGSGSHFGFVLVQEPESSWIGLAGGYRTNTLLDLTAPHAQRKEGSADEEGGPRSGTATNERDDGDENGVGGLSDNETSRNEASEGISHRNVSANEYPRI